MISYPQKKGTIPPTLPPFRATGGSEKLYYSKCKRVKVLVRGSYQLHFSAIPLHRYFNLYSGLKATSQATMEITTRAHSKHAGVTEMPDPLSQECESSKGVAIDFGNIETMTHWPFQHFKGSF